jgi:hypothetical protein
MSCRIVAATLISICALLMEISALGRQTPSVEAQVKAAFLFNFAQFIDWPSQALPDRAMPFTMCITGDPFDGALDKTIEGEMLNGHPIAIRRINQTDNVRGCQLIYVGKAEAKRSLEFITAANGNPILTVGDSEDFINAGGMIRFTEVAHRVRFEINPDAAERVSLRVSSRLLRLADIVRPRQRAAR